MKNLLLILISLVSYQLFAANNDENQARALLRRIAPSYSGKIIFEQIVSDSGKDVFELEMNRHKVLIKGNNANSMAVGLNYYLKYYCNNSVSWFLKDAIDVPFVLPIVTKKVHVQARIQKRFFLNYCTFGYTLVWWQWKDWERLIDWMALNGINLPLAITGQETVWHKVWQSFGLSDSEIRHYFTGPAHLPWHRMSNVDYWESPLPMSWLINQEALQKKIVARERALNMTPVLPAFSGHVPVELNHVYPKAKISKMTQWAGFREPFRSHFIDPEDSLFNIIQDRFLKEQTKLYGTDHVYGLDPFNEVDSPSWEPEYLANVSAKIYNSIKNVDPKATWLQMTWMFYYDSPKWSEPRMKAYLKAVPQDKLLLLDYFCDAEEMWKKTESYYGQPFIWCYLGNFGGNSFLAGDIKEVSNRIENTFANAGKNFWGLGSTLEGFDLNPLIYEFVFEKAWMKNEDIDAWIKNWANRRTGKQDVHVQNAWKILQDKVYTHRIVGWDNTLTNARPQITDYITFQNKYKPWYDNRDLYKAWYEMLQSSDTTHNAYRFDVVNIGRQVMGNYFSELWATFKKAYEEKDQKTMIATAIIMRQILIDTENLLASHQSYLLGNWFVAASMFSDDKDEQLYYRNNARSIITTWGEKGQLLNDYANRSWSGLMGTYYAPRWNMFLDDVIKASEKGVSFDSENFLVKSTQMEWDWAHCDNEFTVKPTNNTIKLSEYLLKKYKAGIEN